MFDWHMHPLRNTDQHGMKNWKWLNMLSPFRLVKQKPDQRRDRGTWNVPSSSHHWGLGSYFQRCFFVTSKKEGEKHSEVKNSAGDRTSWFMSLSVKASSFILIYVQICLRLEFQMSLHKVLGKILTSGSLRTLPWEFSVLYCLCVSFLLSTSSNTSPLWSCASCPNIQDSEMPISPIFEIFLSWSKGGD